MAAAAIRVAPRCRHGRGLLFHQMTIHVFMRLTVVRSSEYLRALAPRRGNSVAVTSRDRNSGCPQFPSCLRRLANAQSTVCVTGSLPLERSM